MKGKKALSELYFWFIRFTLVGAMIISLNLIIGAANSSVIDTHDIEYLILESRILKILAPTDPFSGRISPGIIDMDKFDNQTLNHSLITEKQFTIKLTLNEKEIYFNKEFYDIVAPIAAISKRYQEISKTRYILVKENSTLTPSSLQIIIIFPEK